MDGPPEKKKFVEKRPPDKNQRNKPKYIAKEDAEKQPREKEVQPEKKRAPHRSNKNYYEKPKLEHAQSS